VKAKIEALAQSAMKLGEVMYKAQQEAGARPETGPGSGPEGDVGGGQPGGGRGGDDKVVDAEFEEVDDEKKKGKSA
jgi:molecular chaperone DnaK